MFSTASMSVFPTIGWHALQLGHRIWCSYWIDEDVFGLIGKPTQCKWCAKLLQVAQLILISFVCQLSTLELVSVLRLLPLSARFWIAEPNFESTVQFSARRPCSSLLSLVIVRPWIIEPYYRTPLIECVVLWKMSEIRSSPKRSKRPFALFTLAKT